MKAKIGELGENMALSKVERYTVEGEGVGHQTVMLEYPSKEAAKQAYESKAYQDVVGTRLAATSNHFAVLVDGLPG